MERVNTKIIMYLGSWRKLLSCCTSWWML